MNQIVVFCFILKMSNSKSGIMAGIETGDMMSGYDIAYALLGEANHNSGSPTSQACSSCRNKAGSCLKQVKSTPDIKKLFKEFNARYFYGKLNKTVIEWSPRMTRSAGLCYYKENRRCCIRLSAPLLKARPLEDIVDTLIHEMIHAYLYATTDDKDCLGHGEVFQFHMNRINKQAGTKITVYHEFYDEIEKCRQHWWQCDGPCRHTTPRYGLVKRAINRAPSASEGWFLDHRENCGGTFHKVKEPGKQSVTFALDHETGSGVNNLSNKSSSTDCFPGRSRSPADDTESVGSSIEDSGDFVFRLTPSDSMDFDADDMSCSSDHERETDDGVSDMETDSDDDDGVYYSLV